jgi:predicted esterase
MPDRPTVTGSTKVVLDRPFALTLPSGDPPPAGHPILVGLHGFGETGSMLAGRLEGLAGSPYARMFPDAPFPVELREESGARIGAAWYHYTGDQPAFMKALAFAEGYLRDAVMAAARAHPIDPERIVLLGYSQGGYLAGVAALRDRERYRGLVSVACRVKTEALGRELAAARGYPVLLIHGARDRHTAVDRQQEAYEELLRHGVDATLHVHEGGHGFKAEFGPMIDAFARRALGV